MQRILNCGFYLFDKFTINYRTNLFRFVSFKSSNYYAVLGLEPRASNENVKNAYYELSKKYHPDKNVGDDSAIQKILEINEAFEVLGNKAEKQKYDEQFFPPKRNKFHFIYEHEEFYEPSITENRNIYRKKNPAAGLQYEQYRKHVKGEVKRRNRHMAQKYEFHKNSGSKLFSCYKAKW